MVWWYQNDGLGKTASLARKSERCERLCEKFRVRQGKYLMISQSSNWIVPSPEFRAKFPFVLSTSDKLSIRRRVSSPSDLESSINQSWSAPCLTNMPPRNKLFSWVHKKNFSLPHIATQLSSNVPWQTVFAGFPSTASEILMIYTRFCGLHDNWITWEKGKLNDH